MFWNHEEFGAVCALLNACKIIDNAKKDRYIELLEILKSFDYHIEEPEILKEILSISDMFELWYSERKESNKPIHNYHTLIYLKMQELTERIEIYLTECGEI